MEILLTDSCSYPAVQTVLNADSSDSSDSFLSTGERRGIRWFPSPVSRLPSLVICVIRLICVIRVQDNRRNLRQQTAIRVLSFQINSRVVVLDPKYPHSELTAKIIGAAMEVHKTLGTGFQEVIYQRALALEFEVVGLSFSREHEMHIDYKGSGIGTRRIDFLVEGGVMVEIKALTKLEDVHLAQAINYLEVYNLEVGLLLNFGARSLEFKRVINKKLV